MPKYRKRKPPKENPNNIIGHYKNTGELSNDLFDSDYVQIQLLGPHAKEKNANVLVSTSSFPLVTEFSWYLGKDGYPLSYCSVDGKIKMGGVKLHIFLLKHKARLHKEKMVIDHINRNRLDNRLENLRICTPKQNSYNTTRPKNSKYKYKGVKKQGKTGKWIATASKDGERREIRDIDTQKEAAQIYDMMAEELFGEYAGKNFPK